MFQGLKSCGTQAGQKLPSTVRPDHGLSKGRCWAPLWLQLWLMASGSEGWVITGQGQGAQTKNLQACHKGSGHSQSTKKKSIISNTYLASWEHVILRGNTLEAIFRPVDTDDSRHLRRGFTQTPGSFKILVYSRDRIANYLGHNICISIYLLYWKVIKKVGKSCHLMNGSYGLQCFTKI